MFSSDRLTIGNELSFYLIVLNRFVIENIEPAELIPPTEAH